MMTKYGKYRAIVVDSDDPENRGRVRVKCPSVYNESLSPWCEACLPFISSKGIDVQIPQSNDQIWIEFEGGNINKPIYVGSWLTKDQISGSKTRSANFSSLKVNGVSVALITDIN